MTFVALVLLLAAAPPKGPGQGAVKTSPVSPKYPLLIDADHLKVEGKKQEATWRGHVKVTRGPTHIFCNRLLAYYTEQQEVRRVQCFGNVEVISEDKWAKGDQADFDNITGILVVTGNPEAKQGANHVRGTKVTFSVDEDTIEVDNATAVLKKVPEGPAGASSSGEPAGAKAKTAGPQTSTKPTRPKPDKQVR